LQVWHRIEEDLQFLRAISWRDGASSCWGCWNPFLISGFHVRSGIHSCWKVSQRPNPKKAGVLRGRTTKRNVNKSTRSIMGQQACQVQMQATETETHTQRTERAPSLSRFSSNYGVVF
jgi:hypothetical protein